MLLESLNYDLKIVQGSVRELIVNNALSEMLVYEGNIYNFIIYFQNFFRLDAVKCRMI